MSDFRAWLDRVVRSVRVMTGVTVALVVLLVAGVALAGVFGYQWYQGYAADSARADATEAAKITVTNLLSVSAKTVDHDTKLVLDGATGDFKSQYQSGLDTVKKTVIDNKVDAKGQVLSVSVVSGNERSATVLVAADAKVRNSQVPAGRLSHYRVRTELSDVNGKWLVSKFDFVG